MDRDTAVTRIQDGLGFREDKASTIVLRLQEAQRELEKGKSLPEFLLLEGQTLSVVSGTSTVAKPDNFLRRATTRLRYIPSGGENYAYIGWRGFDDAEQTFASYQANAPQAAVLLKSTIKFYPEPNDDYTVYWDYYRSDDVLTTNVENLWLANVPELLIGEAGLRMAKDLRNKEAITLFTDMKNAAMISLFKDIVLRDTEEDDFLQLGSNA